MKYISSPSNPLIRRLRDLGSRTGREEHSMLLLEGTHLLEEALHNSYVPIEIIATRNWIERYSEILGVLTEQTLVVEVTENVLRSALSTKNPDGVAAVIPLEILPKAKKEVDFVLALDRLQDPGNMGNLFRTALAAEVDILWLALGADPLSQKALRASAGAVLTLPYERLGGTSEIDAVDLLAQRLLVAQGEGYQVVASIVPGTSISKSALPYWELDWEKPTVLVLGNEGSGLHERIQSCCNHFITLPHNPSVESLNVASVAVPMLFERRRVKMTSEIDMNR